MEFQPDQQDIPPVTTDSRFTEVLHLIRQARYQGLQAVNVQLIELYWQVGAYISRLFRMRQFSETYRGDEKVATVWRLFITKQKSSQL